MPASLKKFLFIALIVIGAGLILYSVLLPEMRGAPSPAVSPTMADTETQKTKSLTVPQPETVSIEAAAVENPEQVPVLDDIILGNPAAPVTLIEYASFTCPHCQHLQKDVFPKIKAAYIDTGKVKYIFRDFPLDRTSFAGSIAARCVPPTKYYDMVDYLFTHPDQWTVGEPRPNLLQIAMTFGANAEAFSTCFDNKAIADGIVGIRYLGSKDKGVTSTPTLFIGEKKLEGVLAFEEYSKEIDTQLNKK